MAESELLPLVTSHHQATHPIRFVVVGAGGTGGRLIPPLMQVVRRGDSVAIVDGDHVEDRNLARQNFRARDIGANKAEVMTQRYRRDGIAMDAYAAMLSDVSWREIMAGQEGAPPGGVIVLGCVDNALARQTMQRMTNVHASIWIDGGNETRGGQVILSARDWPFTVKDPPRRGRTTWKEAAGPISIRGMDAMPQLLTAQPDAGGAGCADRLDLQTVAVNQMSATCMLNALTCILYKVPFSSCGVFFSTLNSMSPINLKRVDWDTASILPDMTYASPSTA